MIKCYAGIHFETVKAFLKIDVMTSFRIAFKCLSNPRTKVGNANERKRDEFETGRLTQTKLPASYSYS